MDGIDSNKTALPVNDNDKTEPKKKLSEKDNNAPAKKHKRPRKEQGKEFEKTSSQTPGEKDNKKGSDKKLGESETEIEDETTI